MVWIRCVVCTLVVVRRDRCPLSTVLLLIIIHDVVNKRTVCRRQGGHPINKSTTACTSSRTPLVRKNEAERPGDGDRRLLRRSPLDPESLPNARAIMWIYIPAAARRTHDCPKFYLYTRRDGEERERKIEKNPSPRRAAAVVSPPSPRQSATRAAAALVKYFIRTGRFCSSILFRFHRRLPFRFGKMLVRKAQRVRVALYSDTFPPAKADVSDRWSF